MRQPSGVRDSSAMRTVKCLAAMLALGALGACGGGGGGGGGGDGTYSVGGTASGLGGAGLVLRLNASDSLSVPASGGFTFARRLNSGATYAVSVSAHPAGQNCSVSNASGTVGSANVTDVAVTCVAAEPPAPPPPNTYLVGGMVSGLAGSGLVLSNNGSEDLAIAGNGAFSFAARVATGMPYAVTVATQPSGQACSVANGSGTMAAADIADVAISCVAGNEPPPPPPPGSHGIAGSVSNLTASGLVLHNNGGDAIAVPAGATSFSFPIKVAHGGSYAVTVATQPGSNLDNSQDCTVANGSGTANAEVTNVAVSCGPMGPLRLLGSDPVAGQVNVPRTVRPQLNFSSPLDPASAGAFGMGLVNGGGGPVDFSVAIEGSLATLRPRTKLLPAAAYSMLAQNAALRGRRGEQAPAGVFIDEFMTADNTWREAAVASGPQVLTPDSANREAQPVSAVDAEGNVFAAWHGEPTGVVVNRYSASTGRWDTPVPIVGEAGRTADSTDPPPAIATDAAGNALVVWRQRNLAAYYVLWGARYDRAANAWSTIGVISHTDGSSAYAPRLSLAPDGTAIVVWAREDVVANIAQYEIWWAHANITGNGTWSAPRRLSDASQPSRSSSPPTVAAARAANGQTMVVWPHAHGQGAETVIRGAVISASLASSFTTPVLSNDNGDPEYAPAIAAAGDTFHVVWEQSEPFSQPERRFRNLWMVSGNGNAFGPRRQVAGSGNADVMARAPQIAGCAVLAPLCADARLLWIEGRPQPGARVVTARVGADGELSQAGPLSADTHDPVLDPRIVMDRAGNAIATWQLVANFDDGPPRPGGIFVARRARDTWHPELLVELPLHSNSRLNRPAHPMSLAINPRTGDGAVVWRNVLEADAAFQPSRWEIAVRRFD